MGQVLLVVGQPGLGKSRLVQTLTQRVQSQVGDTSLTAAGQPASTLLDQESPVIEWRCSQHFQNSELYPVSDYLERFLGVGHNPSPTARFDRLARHLEDYDLCKPELLALFAKLLFLPPNERYSGTGLTPAREREETFRALGQWLCAHSDKRPILLVVEDLHWIDASTLEFLGHFIGEGPHDRRCSSSRAPSTSPSVWNTHYITRLGFTSIAGWGFLTQAAGDEQIRIATEQGSARKQRRSGRCTGMSAVFLTRIAHSFRRICASTHAK